MPTRIKDQTSEFRASLDHTDSDTGTISGVAVKYGTPIERAPGLYERVDAGAFKAQVGAPNRVMVLWQHDRQNPIGRATTLLDSPDELRFEAKIVSHEDLPEARKVLTLLREGVVDEISVGFDWGTWTEVTDKDNLTIVHTKARLREFSVVTFGALGRQARVMTVAAEQINPEILSYRARLAKLTS